MFKRFICAALTLAVLTAVLLSGGCVSAAVYSFEAEGDLSIEFTNDDEFYYYGDASLLGGGASSSPAKLERPETVLDAAFTDTAAVLLAADGLYGAGTIADLPFGDASTLSTDGFVKFVYSEGADDPDFEVRVVPVDLSETRQVVAGADFVLVRELDGRVYGWGANPSGQLGSAPDDLVFSNVPVRVGELEGISEIAAGRGGLCAAIDMNGHVWVWGNGAASDGGAGGIAMLPIEKAVHVVCGEGIMAVLDADAKVWLWTPDAGVKTGYEDGPAVVGSLPGIYSLAGGDGFFAAMDGDGAIWTFGANDECQLGRETPDGAPDWTPAKVEGLKDVISISSGRAHTMAMTKNMTIYLWGSNSGGQLGRDGENSASPTEAPLIRMSLAAGR